MTKKERELKVYETSGYHRKTVPNIMLQGEWLRTWGFNIGDKIIVECSDGVLLVKKIENMS